MTARCRDCATPVLRFVDDVGLTELVEVEPLSPLADQPDRHRLWEHHPTWGWINAPLGFRGWPIHVTHQCTRDRTSTSQRRSTA
jgi:hypothetical protein